MSVTQPVLSIRGLTVRFGGLVAINALDLDVTPGHIFALVGPNGAGKTTVLNCISGFVQPGEGRITFEGADLLPLGRDRRAALGIARTFQNLQLFASMTVLDNLLVAQHAHLRTGLFAGLVSIGRSVREDAAARCRARETLALLDLERYVSQPAGSLPFGMQQLVGVARALVLRPRLLLLDEPAAGMPHVEVEKLAASLRRWRDELSTTLVLIEHNMPLVQSAADTVCVLDYGRKLAEGAPDTVLKDAAVLEAYLGRRAVSEEGSGHAEG
ncbi:MAG TPA: ABC transporter ATP-binding protein [Ktedonobacterales bacterium]|nr:ABC transporter ATP-binding protein [Ktedonobacterales bacterium]